MPRQYFQFSSRKHGYWGRLARFMLIAILVALIGTFYGALPLIYADNVAHPQRLKVCCTSPKDYGFVYEDVEFTTSDSIKIRGWLIPSKNGAVVILAHPLGSNRVGMLEQGISFARNGFGVLLIDLRAHGESQGELISFTGEDIVAAARYLASRTDLRPKRIGVLGASLGGVIAIHAAASSNLIDSLVVDGAGVMNTLDEPAPTSIPHLLDLPFHWVANFRWHMLGITPTLPTIQALPKISPRAIMIVSGTKSAYERGMMRKFAAAAKEPRELWEVSEAGHLGAWASRTEEYEARVIQFFARTLLQ